MPLTKILSTTVLCFALIGCVPSQPDQATGTDQKHAQHKEDSSTTNDKSQTTAQHSGQPNSNSPKWYNSVKRPEWWLVVLGFITLFFVGWQSRETSKSAEASKKSARASFMNAKTARKAERAWLKIGTDEERFNLVPENMAYFHWKITNTGKTPARIIGTQCVCQMVSRDELRNLSEEPKYGGGPIHPLLSEMIPLNNFLLAPNETLQLYTPILGSGNGPLLWTQMWQDALVDDRVMIRAYGYVRYLDTFGEERRSNFCDFYQAHPNNPSLRAQFRPLFGIPPAYNEYT